MALKYSRNQSTVAIINDGETAVTFNEVENNAGLMGITYNLLKPDIVMSQNFRELVLEIKESSPTDLSIEEIAKIFSKPRESIAKLAYIIVGKKHGTFLGFVIDNKMQTLVIPRFTDIDCVIEVMTAIDSDEVSYYVDCTNRRVFTPDQVGRLGH